MFRHHRSSVQCAFHCRVGAFQRGLGAVSYTHLDKIATLEADFSKYASDFVKLNELTQEKEAAEQQLEEKMERWMYF